MPSGLDIEREQSLNGSMAAYATQILISTGKDDWTSRIDEEEDAFFARQLRHFLGRGGRYSDPYNNILVTHASFPPTPAAVDTSSAPPLPPSPSSTPPSSSPPTSAYILPTFTYVPTVPTDAASVEAFLRAYLLPTRLHASHTQALSREDQNVLLRAPHLRKRFPDERPVEEILVLICGHGGRDDRCGIMGPLLRAEFEEKLHRQGIRVLREGESGRGEDGDGLGEGMSRDGEVPAARVGLISHIGGHKFAGNVIIYIPPTFGGNLLKGKGIWYGRVGPEHVEGIVAQTVLGGKVIKDMFRGGIDQSGEILRL